jgi:hypothetical protein
MVERRDDPAVERPGRLDRTRPTNSSLAIALPPRGIAGVVMAGAMPMARERFREVVGVRHRNAATLIATSRMVGAIA